ncbi:MAG: rubrerythrin family protein [Chrysiogenales bacterium]|nr:MAG: rubrerythrin family protein [Chrysiogenales bacterium]
MKERTAKNVHDAFVGEAKAYQRLLEYAKKAGEEGFLQVAHLFRAVAASESVHSRRHFRLLESIKDTQSNMEQAFQQENAVNGVHYPKMLNEAEEEGEKAAALVFSQARDVEGVHSKLYRKALDHLAEEKSVEYHVCEVCGYLHENEPPDKCPVCSAPKEKFFRVE